MTDIDIDYSFDSIDFNSIIKKDNNHNKNNNKDKNVDIAEVTYDKTTNETYRIKRLFKIDPITDQEIPTNLLFEFEYSWNPYSGIRDKIDIIGPLCFNAINLYDHYFLNRYKGLWNPPDNQFQGYYGDLLGTGKGIQIKSRGLSPEKYLYRLPIIDCYLPHDHNFSVVTFGPELNDNEITQIDKIVLQFHPKKSHSNFTPLSTLKYYYDNAISSSPDPNSTEIKELKNKYPSLSDKEINDKYNRFWVDKLVKIKY